MNLDKDAVARRANEKAILVQREHVAEDIAIAAQHDFANKVSAGNVPPNFNEDIYVVLFAQFKERQISSMTEVLIIAFLIGGALGLLTLLEITISPLAYVFLGGVITAGAIVFFIWHGRQNGQMFWGGINLFLPQDISLTPPMANTEEPVITTLEESPIEDLPPSDPRAAFDIPPQRKN